MEGRYSTQIAALITARQESAQNRTWGDLIDEGEAVESLLEHPGWVHVQGLLDELHAAAMHDLKTGRKPLEQAEYAQKLGFLNGLEVAADCARTAIGKGEWARNRVNQAAESAAREAGAP
jgi:hypothetical protein